MNKFEVYEGKKGDRTEVGLGAIVVTSLTKKIQNHYHQVYFDNYFTSIDLLVKLLRNGIYSCGTFRKDRKGFPQSLKHNNEERIARERRHEICPIQKNCNVCMARF
jgi:hypothetical protein